VADKQKSSRSTTARTRVVTAEGDTSNKNETKVTKTASKPKAVTAKPETEKQSKAKKKRYNIFVAFWGYLKGAWYELRQVRWPNRKETWGMTFAVILFTLFFVVLVLLLDAGYKYLFDIILKR